jgi:hypothetical protein
MNTLWALFEILLPRTEPPPWIHLLLCIVFLALYLALAYVTHATQGWYPYDFLDPTNGKGLLCGYVFGILAGISVIFVVVWYVIRFRLWLTERVLGLEGKFAYHHLGGAVLPQRKDESPIDA